MKTSGKVYTINPKTENEPKVTNAQVERSLHGSLRWVLVLAQCFGQMPVIGITKSDTRYLTFSWKSWRTFYCVLNCVGSGFVSGFFIYKILTAGANLFEYSSLVFHFSTFMVSLFFLKLATEWPQLMRKWSCVEFSMRSYGWPPYLHTRIAIMSITIVTIAAVEYTMTKLSKLFISMRCKRDDEELFEYYFTIHLYADIFHVVGYSSWKGVVLQIVNLLVTFAWSFNDLFIMLLSTALALRFKQITARLKLLQSNTKPNSVSIWRETREDYNRLSKLTRSLDEALSYITITSFASNLYFILIQLFHSLRKMKDTLEKVYFFFSFAFLLLRTVCVSLYGGWIYDESKEPLAILNSVSSEVYNIEIKRFIEQVKFDTVALTGKNFFYVTRRLILSMAGAIVTYELVLIQFNESLLKESAEEAKNITGVC